MRVVHNHKVYDTATARFIGRGKGVELYCKRGGEYFIHDGTDNIGLSIHDAKELAASILTETEFNTEFREKPTGRKILSLSVSAENDALLRQLAAEKSMTVSRAVEWLIEEHFHG